MCYVHMKAHLYSHISARARTRPLSLACARARYLSSFFFRGACRVRTYSYDCKYNKHYDQQFYRRLNDSNKLWPTTDNSTTAATIRRRAIITLYTCQPHLATDMQLRNPRFRCLHRVSQLPLWLILAVNSNSFPSHAVDLRRQGDGEVDGAGLCYCCCSLSIQSSSHYVRLLLLSSRGSCVEERTF